MQYGKAGSLDYKLIHAQNIIRPQLRFKDRVDNSANTPWIRKITVKPNAKVPLDYGIIIIIIILPCSCLFYIIIFSQFLNSF